MDIKDYYINVKTSSGIQTYSHTSFLRLSRYLFENGLSKETLPLSPSKNIIQSAYNEQESLFWLRDQEYMFVTNKQQEVIFQLPYQALETEHRLFPILFDGEKTWFSDGVQGIQIITLQSNHFQNTRPLNNGRSNSMRGILEDISGNIWFSTIDDIGKYDKNGQKTVFPTNDWFTTFLEDKKGNIWWGDRYVFKKYNPQTNSIESYKTDSDSLPHDFSFFWSLYEAENGEIWISAGTHIFAFNPETETFRSVVGLEKEEEDGEFDIYNMQTSIFNPKHIWVCTNQSLFLCHEDGKILAKFNDKQEAPYYLPDKNFKHMYQEKGKDGEAIIWLATGGGGLIRWTVDDGRWTKNTVKQSPDNYQDQPSTVYRQFTISSGLSSNALHSVYEDNYGYLWMSSDLGLMQFDKKNEQVTKYFKNDGTADSEFNRAAHSKAPDGTLYFGTINGWTTFHPRDYANTRERLRASQLTFKTFKQFSNEQSTLIDLTANLHQTSTIKLEAGDRFFSIDLALLDLYNAQNTTYSYRVKGLYDWQSSKSPILNISSLPYGTHSLEITAQNGNGQKAANTLVFNVKVLRPFYLQWWFIALMLSGIGVGLFLYIKWRTEQLLIAQETIQLRQLDQLKTKFFANISHELRTPITLILAPLSQILKNEPISDGLRQKLSKVQQNGKSLLNLVNEILDLSKLEAEKLELQTQPTEIPTFFEHTVMLFESAAKVKNIDFQFVSTLSKDLVIELDQSKMEKVMNNLISNALKFTPQSRIPEAIGTGGQIQVSLVELPKNQLQIKVKDNGRGIHPDDLKYIFERYFQSKTNTTLEGGTGIGLALTKELVELMDGTISVYSEIDKGTTFEIRMPYVSCELPIAGYELPVDLPVVTENIYSPLPKTIQPKTSTEKDTILLVEDNPSLQEFIQSILTPFYNVIVTNNGVEALKWLNEPSTVHRLPSTVLSDVMMPEMDGFTLLEQVKASDDFCSIPFILLTARADIQDKLHGLRIGVDDYMTKPFEVEELLLRIRNLIANSKNRSTEQVEASQLSEKANNKVQKPGEKRVTNHQSSVTSHDLEWLKKLETIALREVHNKQFVLEHLAVELFVSKRQLTRKVKQITGLTPNKYIRTVRLRKAKTILETEEIKTVTEVAYAVGFEGVTHFSKLFYAEYGKYPKDYLS